MGKLSGTVLVLAGVLIAAYALSSQHQTTGPKVATTQGQAQTMPRAAPDTSPSDVAPEPAIDPAPAALPSPKIEAPARAGFATKPPATLAPAPLAPPRPIPGVPAAVRVAEAPPRLPVGATTAAASPPLDRPALTREIQRQLKRIGCYQGAVSGVWSASVQQAMKAFTDRVNASLPIDQPDPVLLAMVQGHEPGACSASCPTGQSRAKDRRCLPDALVASAAKPRTPVAPVASGRVKQTPPVGARSATAEATVPPTPTEGRMSLAGPTAYASRPVRPRPPHARVTSSQARASAHYRPPSVRVRQRSAQRSGVPFWSFLLP